MALCLSHSMCIGRDKDFVDLIWFNFSINCPFRFPKIVSLGDSFYTRHSLADSSDAHTDESVPKVLGGILKL